MDDLIKKSKLKKVKIPWSGKSEGMQNALKALFPEQAKNIKENKCALCGSTKVTFKDFRDNLSRKEFGISGKCQSCQDKIWK